MKKIVLTIIALVCFINVNAQRVEMNYENTFEPIFEVRNISARGTANITLNYSDVIVSINCTGFTEFSNKGVVIDDDHNCLEFVGDIEEEGAATFTVSLSDNAKQANKYIKKVTFITRGNSDITSVIGSNDAGSDTDVKFVGTNRIAIESGFDKISEFEIDFTYNDYVQLKSIMVEYGYFDDELTLTDDSYDYFGDYRYAKKVTYTRPMNSEKWGSLCLPFNYVVDDSKFSVYSIKGAGLNGSNAPITLSKVANGTEVVAGTPVFVYCTEPNLVVSAENVLLTTEDFNSSGLIYEYGTTEALKDGNENPISPSLNYTFYGTIKNVTVTDAIFVENDIFKYKNGTAKTFQPYRAYFTLEGNNSGTGSLTFRVLNGSNLTSVAGVCGAEGHETDVKWELTDMDNNGSLETLTISGTGAMTDYASSGDNMAPWQAYRENIENLVIKEGVTRIGDNAFGNCIGLTEITLPASLTSIGMLSFKYCNNLTIVHALPTTPPTMANNAMVFNDDVQLNIFVAADCVESYKSAWLSFYSDNIKAVGGDCGEGLKWAYDNGTLTIFGSGVMDDYTSGNQPWAEHLADVTEVVVGKDVSAIGQNAFRGCTSLVTVTSRAIIVPTFGSDALADCTALDEIFVPVTSETAYEAASGWSAFSSVMKGINGTCGENVKWAYSNGTLTIFGNGEMTNGQPWGNYLTDIKSIVIESGVETIGGAAFAGCSNLTSVTIPNSVTNIKSGAFAECTSLTDITLSANLTYLDDSAFWGCTSLAAITIPEGVSFIGYQAFGECTSLTEITIPSSVEAIGSDAFNSCTSLASVIVKRSESSTSEHPISEMYWSAFVDNAEGLIIYVPTDMVDVYKAADYWHDYEECIKGINDISIHDHSPNSELLTVVDGTSVTFTLQGRTLYKDGSWNTLCLPFDVTLSGSVLDGAIVKKLDATNSNLSSDGTLTLNFVAETTKLTAGTPYLIRWTSGDHLVNPVFTDVTIDADASTSVNFNGGAFVGTYSPVSFAANTKSILFLGAENKLYWPNADMTLNACRAYFDLGTNEARRFVVNFNDDEDNTTGIAPLLSPEGDDAGASPRGGLVGASWYDLQGRRLSQKPTKAGLYIYKGKKLYVK